MKKANKKVSDKTDIRLAGNVPTAESPEFVPKPINAIGDPPYESTQAVFDIIPEIKGEKYKK